MALDLQQELKQAHALLDQLPPAKLGAVRSLLEVMVDDDEPVSDEDRRRFHEGQAFFASGKGIPMDDVLAEFGLKPEDFPLSK
jgi:hypothetical protein